DLTVQISRVLQTTRNPDPALSIRDDLDRIRHHRQHPHPGIRLLPKKILQTPLYLLPLILSIEGKRRRLRPNQNKTLVRSLTTKSSRKTDPTLVIELIRVAPQKCHSPIIRGRSSRHWVSSERGAGHSPHPSPLLPTPHPKTTRHARPES